MSKRVDGKVAIVTGAASGIGVGIVKGLLDEGAHVVATDINTMTDEGLAGESGCTFITQDVTVEEEWADLVKRVERDHGMLHILVNNAGVEGDTSSANPETTTLEDWRFIMRVNVEGVFLGCRAVMDLMRRSGGGSIINMSSTAALVPAPDFIAYSASKATVLHLTKSIAVYGARDGANIRCNSIHPGFVQTPMLERIIKTLMEKNNQTREEAIETFIMNNMPLREFSDVEEIAGAVLYLASDDARHITATRLVIDGGTTASL